MNTNCINIQMFSFILFVLELIMSLTDSNIWIRSNPGVHGKTAISLCSRSSCAIEHESKQDV